MSNHGQERETTQVPDFRVSITLAPLRQSRYTNSETRATVSLLVLLVWPGA